MCFELSDPNFNEEMIYITILHPRYIHGEEVDEVERVKRDVKVATVEKDIR